MPEGTRLQVAIVDYGLGNLYSIANACRHVGFDAEVVSSAADLERAASIVLPGVGAFGDAMNALRHRDLVAPLKDAIARGTPVLGVCLGLQLLMTESYEFGTHQGLGIIEGTVEHLGTPIGDGRRLKVPHVGWARLEPAGRPWSDTPLDAVAPGTFMYFVHSYCVRPADPRVVLSLSTYGDVRFCSSVQQGTVFACQFHPERSAVAGLAMYRTFRRAVLDRTNPA